MNTKKKVLRTADNFFLRKIFRNTQHSLLMNMPRCSVGRGDHPKADFLSRIFFVIFALFRPAYIASRGFMNMSLSPAINALKEKRIFVQVETLRVIWDLGITRQKAT